MGFSIDDVVGHLRAAGVRLAPGLADGELVRLEDFFGFQFCTDHRRLLSAAMPVGEHWVDWRSEDLEGLRSLLARPVAGLLFDVLHNGFWLASWGERPGQAKAALAAAEGYLASVPTLVPVYAHRFLPAAPAPAGAPVFSVHQSDVICYGTDLLDYVLREFGEKVVAAGSGDAAPHIAFWSDLADGTLDVVSPPA